ncbi:hypothetical protein LPB90_17965 [Chryseobacterium sp. LC2016-29]|uniref:hypothetical protein n=1 Tax=Chryseobacterium sp. LC2016-29 TaxID=2897331 RepID=UPI001E635B60|nr:hypothetical protein [Chryseobacterium sp. LC2016-29]MCD0480327.1 hypothetical protein [Chryseobacterium sp. LC2016-29]
MKKFTYIYIVLVYKNHKDLQSFFKTLDTPNAKVIVVNSFYDENSKNLIEEIALQNNADFINLPNKGYGFGNDTGLKYALNNYDFDFAIVNNADIEIKKFNAAKIATYSKDAIYAPKIKTKSNKDQNPFIINYSSVFRYIYYQGCKKQSNALKYFPILINGVIRRVFNLFINSLRLNHLKIYSFHGSFFLIGKEALEKIYPLYLHEMFLYQEEHYLARKAYLNNVNTYFIPQDIEIKHFEDGSIDFNNQVLGKHMSDSYIIYYEFFNNLK